MSITLAELKTAARERADMEDSQFVTDSELLFYINSSIAELHDILIQSYGQDYYIKSTIFTTANAADEYSLDTIIPSKDFYKMRGVDAKITASQWFTLKAFNFNERNKFQDSGSYNLQGTVNTRYRMVGNALHFAPRPDDNTEIRLWYIPLATKLTADTDTLDDLNQYAEYVIVDVAIKMLTKEETNANVLIMHKQELKQRIEAAAANRDASASETVQDIYSENNPYVLSTT